MILRSFSGPLVHSNGPQYLLYSWTKVFRKCGPSLSSMANRLVSLEECGKRSRSAEPSATLKKQSGINGLLPSLAALGGPLHLFRLLLDLCSRFSNRVAVTFPQEKSLLDFPG